MKQKISTQLSVGFVIIVLTTVLIISVTSNVLIKHRFEKYVIEQQQDFIEQLAATLEHQYNSINEEWNLEYIHGVGMYALNDGYIIRLYDNEQNIIWDAQNHDMTLCHQVMQKISDRMDEKQIEGSFSTYHHNLNQNGNVVGYVEVDYYSPYYYNESDFKFLDSLNKVLFIVGILSIVFAVILGVIFARGLSIPLVKLTDVTRKISQGNYNIRFKSNVRTQELAELSNAVNHMAENLEVQEGIRKRMTSDVAHELRTPIANVSSHLEAIIEGVWEVSTERLQSCYDELNRISNIISDLEKLHEIEDDNINLEKESVDLLELSQSVLIAFEPKLQEKHITSKIIGNSTVISGDIKRLYQVIFNLVSNAIKYSTDNGYINISINEDKETATIIVEDNGIGIAKKDSELVFERFYRTDISRNRKTGGTGIGLAIVKAIVDAHNGRVYVESEEGRGSRFVVILPKK